MLTQNSLHIISLMEYQPFHLTVGLIPHISFPLFPHLYLSLPHKSSSKEDENPLHLSLYMPQNNNHLFLLHLHSRYWYLKLFPIQSEFQSQRLYYQFVYQTNQKAYNSLLFQNHLKLMSRNHCKWPDYAQLRMKYWVLYKYFPIELQLYNDFDCHQSNYNHLINHRNYMQS